MTEPQSLDDITNLLLTYPGVPSACAFRIQDRDEVRIRFRCTNADSLRAIAVAAVWSNVLITLGDPDSNICAEPPGARDLPCDIAIPDDETQPLTQSERFGVWLSEDLESQGLITLSELERLHLRWNTRLLKRHRNP
jgi:hypothetical protein